MVAIEFSQQALRVDEQRSKKFIFLDCRLHVVKITKRQVLKESHCHLRTMQYCVPLFLNNN
jgi:hypothetical protein